MKVAIIGSGASGLTAIKCCLDEGLRPVCFEKQGEMGGLWNYVPAEKDGATVYKSAVINSSKEMMCFSDFPIAKECPNFMHNSAVLEYFKSYAKRFRLLEHVKFQTEVVSCTPADGFAKHGHWKILTRNSRSKEEKTEYFENLLVCVGHHAIPHYPLHDFPGIESFKGKCMHSHDYRDFKGFENLKVVVIGIGNSGGDIAVDLSKHAKQVYLSTRRGTWVFKRIHKSGLPSDVMLSTRFGNDIFNLIPHGIMEPLIRKSLDDHLDHEKYGLKPDHGVFSQHPCVNDEIANCIITGRIRVKTNVARFAENSAIFEDGTEEQIDAVIFATGYSMSYPFLSEDIVKVEKNSADLYKYMYPISLPRNTLAIIGAVQPFGPTIPISEMQCRHATKVFKGEVLLPTRDKMKADIDKKRRDMGKRFVKSRRHTVQVKYTEYMDELAEQISCKPDIRKQFLSDPALAVKLYFGPAVPSIYRLEGPGKWPKARETIMTVRDRVLYPLQTRKVEIQHRSYSILGMSIIVLAAAFVVCIFKAF